MLNIVKTPWLNDNEVQEIEKICFVLDDLNQKGVDNFFVHDSIIHFLYESNSHENTRPTHCDNGQTLKLMRDLLNEPTCNIDKYINNDETTGMLMVVMRKCKC